MKVNGVKVQIAFCSRHRNQAAKEETASLIGQGMEEGVVVQGHCCHPTVPRPLEGPLCKPYRPAGPTHPPRQLSLVCFGVRPLLARASQASPPVQSPNSPRPLRLLGLSLLPISSALPKPHCPISSSDFVFAASDAGLAALA